MTIAEYIFGATMTLMIVWLVAEISATGALKGPQSVQRAAINRHK
jgi:hypothetical protein